MGHRPLVEIAPGLREADIALTEIINGKLTYELTAGGDAAEAQVLQFPSAVEKKKAA